MNCHNFDERIQQLLDNRQPLASDAQLRAHALSCPNCEENLALYQTLLRGSRQMPRPMVDAGFAARAVAQAQRQPVEFLAGGERSPRVRLLAPLAAIAALVLLAVGVGVWSNPSRTAVDVTAKAPGQTERKSDPVARGVVGLAVPGPVGKARSVGDVIQPVSPAARPQAVAPVVPYAAATASSPYDYRTAFESFAGQLPGTVGQFEYAPGVRPIRESFSTAFEVLLRTLPGRAEGREAEPAQSSFLGGEGGSLV